MKDAAKLSPREEPVKANHREKFVMIDPLKIDKRLLYQTEDGKYRIGLILHTEPDSVTKKLKVTQAMPSKLFHEGVKSPTVGDWHVLRKNWAKKSKRQ